MSLDEYLQNYMKLTQDQAMVIVDVVKNIPTTLIDPYLLLAIMEQETRYRPNLKNKSGSVGLMQVVPYWHRAKIKGRNVMDPHVNAEVGAMVYFECFKKKRNITKALTCYNGGGTKGYSEKVVSRWKQLQKLVSLT